MALEEGVGVQHEVRDLLEGLVELLLDFETPALLDITELIVAVHRLLLNLDHVQLGQFLADLQNLRIVALELLHPVVDFGTLLAAVSHEELLDAVRGPVELRQSRADLAIQRPDVVVEETPLLGLQRRHDLVVITHHPQHVLAENADLVAVARELVSSIGDDDAAALNLLPVVHLLNHLHQFMVEVALEQAALELAADRLLRLHEEVHL
mmetsp:Transcript_7265/g.17199  ORF Transcript_7265/g.17199 Transcript_7265/m.17199 type:complete len:209 (-) Transcript_7265:1605-2231(-)